MNFLLRIKHWQLFVLTAVIPFLTSLGIMLFTITKMISALTYARDGQDPSVIFDAYADTFPMFSVLIVLSLIVVAWRFSVVDFAIRNRLPSTYRLNRGVFLTALLLPVILGLTFSLSTGPMMESMASVIEDTATSKSREIPDGFGSMAGYMIVMMPLSLISLLAQFYTYYETGRAIKSAEIGREATLSECLVETILNWFFFIGVWWLQPRVNRMALSENGDQNIENELIS